MTSWRDWDDGEMEWLSVAAGAFCRGARVTRARPYTWVAHDGRRREPAPSLREVQSDITPE